MRRGIALLICTITCGPPAGFASAATETQAETPQAALIPTGIAETPLVAVASSSSNPSRIFVASEHAVYESADLGHTWQERFRFPARTIVRSIALEPGEAPTILVATSQGVYRASQDDDRWTRVYKGIGEAQADCRHVVFHPAQLGVALLGTRNGLLISIDRGTHWKPVEAPPSLRDVVHVALDPHDPNRVLAATSEILFEGHLRDGTWQERYRTGSTEGIGVEAGLEAQETAEATAPLHILSSIARHPEKPAVLYLGTSRGLLFSEDAGASWQHVPQAGLPDPMVTRLLLRMHSPLAVYTGTDKGLARLDPDTEQWTVLTSGLAATRVHDLAASGREVWAATDQGLVRYTALPTPLPEPSPPTPQEILSDLSHEPTIAQVQEAAIRYAEVHPDKIRRWRQQAALKALLPTVDMGYDRDRSQDISVDEGTFPRFQLIETEVEDSGLDFSVTWDLGELLWNNDQTSIDTRSKLMVELREDLVDRVTRTYFERRRLQLALLSSPPATQEALLDKELRVQELTALIDGLTGGYFSQQARPWRLNQEDGG
jgi:hypothetical protein